MTDASNASCLAIFGTGSDVGKSIVVTALCRIFADLGLRTTPFKAQNMSNNSFVTLEGGEMGRSQVAQAEAARIPPHVDMNPVLLKPSSDVGSQVIVHGLSIGNRQARDYWGDTQALCAKAGESLTRLRDAYDLVILEGAGSCGEVNLRDRDFVNFRMAHTADASVILVADIDRGGVFAQIIGTMEVIPEEDRKRVAGFIINRFRGDPGLFEDGIHYIEQRTGLPVFGVIPYNQDLRIDAEDSLALDAMIDPAESPDPDRISVAVLLLPRISNFTDFAPLERDPGIQVHYLVRPRDLNGYDLVLLPGTKNVRRDLDWLRERNCEERL